MHPPSTLEDAEGGGLIRIICRRSFRVLGAGARQRHWLRTDRTLWRYSKPRGPLTGLRGGKGHAHGAGASRLNDFACAVVGLGEILAIAATDADPADLDFLAAFIGDSHNLRRAFSAYTA